MPNKNPLDTDPLNKDRVNSLFDLSPAPILDLPSRPTKRIPTKEKKPPKKITSIKISNFKTLLTKLFNECDTPINRFKDD